ncbi:L-rhamnose/proton symporter RhaT [Filimonas effusa]|uniref:L-rhamnose/proton symporter RhaT n=1 Tax=Filimonas effusa TaxID=2508721 RepID=A0A4Q1D3T2_9BACT|nr:L-rhamnose/proton symporter RhaT [Filimonas effusa]RXK83070.1 L-rhamnose/proton symporter RhaT [Filimonas effusa]
MGVLLGVIFHFIGGFASGSFYIPYNKVKKWAWESYWIVGGLFSWLIVPPLAAWLTVPGFAEIIADTSTSTLTWTFFMGVLWGIGGLTYGLGVRYLGIALGSCVILGLCSVFGSLIPSVYYDIYPEAGKDSMSIIASNHWGRLILAGIVVCIIGIVICGKAGMLKDKDLSSKGLPAGSHDFRIGKGLFVAIVSGILSACFNFGIEAGKPMAELAVARGSNPLFQNNVIYVVLLWGGLTTNFIWCMILNFRNRTFGNYTNKKTPLLLNYVLCALAGTTWFLQFFFYGMGESKLGNGASSWILHMAFIILIANVWGLVLKEWKGVSRKTYATVIAGIVVIMASILLVGYGNSEKSKQAGAEPVQQSVH